MIAEYDDATDTTSIVNHIAYSVFGEATSQTNSSLDILPFYYTARYFDAATGLQYNTNRWYNPELNRWMNAAPALCRVRPQRKSATQTISTGSQQTPTLGGGTYPASILVRRLRYQLAQRGFRTRQNTLTTTLLQADVYRAEDLVDLYRPRWQAELHIRSSKTQMQMDHLRCNSAAIVLKELHCHLIGYKLVRAAMLATALKIRLPPSRLSFTGVLQTTEEFAAALRWNPKQQEPQWTNVLQTIRQLEVGARPDRNEPRELKRRAKEYKLMQTPRNRYATAA